MRRAWITLGHVAYWLSWPLLYVYLRIGKRTRAIVYSGDEVLVAKGWLGDGKWMLPGGGIHRNEPAAAGAVREVFEETGVSVDIIKLTELGEYEGKHHGLRYQYIGFKIKLPSKFVIKPQRFEIIDAQWMPAKSLQPSNCEPASYHLLQGWLNRH